MSITVPASPLAAHLVATSADRPIVVRAHARRRAFRDAVPATPRDRILAAQHRRMEAATTRYQGVKWRGMFDAVVSRAFDRMCAETAALDVLTQSRDLRTVGGTV